MAVYMRFFNDICKGFGLLMTRADRLKFSYVVQFFSNRHEDIITNANKKEIVKTNKNTLLIEVKKTVFEMQHLIFLDNLSCNTKMLFLITNFLKALEDKNMKNPSLNA